MPREGTILRSALIQAVEAGISSARTLTPLDKLALRMFAVVETEVTVGSFDACPLTKAGLYKESLGSRDEARWEALSRFYGSFDRVADAAVRPHYAHTLKVID